MRPRQWIKCPPKWPAVAENTREIMTAPEHAHVRPTRNLLIVHSVGSEDISDWEQVKRQIEEQAPDIEVRIANNFAPNSVTRRWQVTRPSLVFAASHLAVFQPKGGTLYVGHPMPKSEQIARLAQQNLPVPATLKLTRDNLPSVAEWGPYVVVKPEGGGRGRGVRVVQSQRLSTLYDNLTMNDRYPMIVQPYIDHSSDGCPTGYRVLTLFGHVLYCSCYRWGRARAPLEEVASDPDGIIASNDSPFGIVRSVCNDLDIIALGEKAYRAFSECAVLGVDVLRESSTGQLYIMETNPEGRTWHLSSRVSKNLLLPNMYVSYTVNSAHWTVLQNYSSRRHGLKPRDATSAGKPVFSAVLRRNVHAVKG